MMATSIGFMSVWFSCCGLLERMRPGEGVDLHALVVDAHGGRHRPGVAVEISQRADHLRSDADVGDGGGVAVAEAAGFLLFREVALDCFERAQGPVCQPAVARFLVGFQLLLEVGTHARHDQRMPIRRGDEREAAHARPAARILRQERGLRMRLLDVLEDGERLDERRTAIVEHQRRHHALRVHREIVVAVLPALEQVDGDFLGLQALHGERHAHAVTRERAPEAVQLHWLTLMFASLMSLAYLAISSLMNAANSAGVLDTASTPRSAKRFFTSGSASAFTVSAFSLSTIAFGLPAGSSTPHQLTATRPGAASRHSGGSGSSA